MSNSDLLRRLDAMLPVYASWLQKLAESVSDILLTERDLPEGSRVLDVCGGSGALAVAAAERGYQVTSVEMSPMTATYLAGRLAPYGGSTGMLVDPQAMPYEADTFDAAFSVLKLLSLGPISVGATREMCRVVRPGGTIAVAHWAVAHASPVHKILVDASRDLDDPRISIGADQVGYVAPEELAGFFTAAGLAEVRVESRALDLVLPVAEDFWMEMHPIMAMQPDFVSLTAGERARLEGALIERLRRIQKGLEPNPQAQFNVVYAEVPGTAPAH